MHRALKFRFIIFLVFILSTAVGISSYLHLRIQDYHLREVTKEKLNDIATTVQNSIRSLMKEGRIEEARSIIDAVGSLPDLDRVRVFSPTGNITMSSRPEEVGSKVDAEDLQIFHHQRFQTVFNEKNFEQPVFYIIKPILNEPDCFRCHGTMENQIIGVLEVDVSLDSIQSRLSATRQLMVTSAVLTIIALILSINLLITVLVNRPIDALLCTIRKARKGDLEVRVKPSTTQEFFELGENFNTMLASLGEARKDLKQYHEEQLERADRLATLGELAAGIAHEIKNPLAGIGGAIQVLKQNRDNSPEHVEIFDEILKQIDRIDGDVKDLLSYARTGEPEFELCDVNALIRQSLSLIRDHAGQHNVDIKTHFAEDELEIEIDKKQIQQVLINLGLNAIQAMPQGGVLTLNSNVSSEMKGIRQVEIIVQDTGQGIPIDKLDKIFTPFFTTRHTGTGLGLSISQKIIAQHKGELRVASEEDCGTRFIIVLPANRSESKTSPEERN